MPRDLSSDLCSVPSLFGVASFSACVLDRLVRAPEMADWPNSIDWCLTGRPWNTGLRGWVRAWLVITTLGFALLLVLL